MADIPFQTSAQQIIDLVGGFSNVNHLTHCMTRLRFNLKDESLAIANKSVLEKVPGVLQVVQAGGQFQVVIGKQVEQMYQSVMTLKNSTLDAEPVEQEQSLKNKKFTDSIMEMVSGIIVPFLPALMASAFISISFVLLKLLGLVSENNGIGFFMNGLGQACMYFTPILLGGSAAKYFNLNVYLGNLIGASLLYPTFIEAATKQETIKLFGIIPLVFLNYSQTVFPVIAAVWIASKIYKLLQKIVPKILQSIFVPALAVFISVLVTMTLVGPVIVWLSFQLAAVMSSIYEFSPIVTGILLGATWLIFIVPLGLHWGFIPIFITNLGTLGYEPIMGLLAAMSILSGTAFAAAFRNKDKEKRSEWIGYGILNFLGVSEPALFGIVLRNKLLLRATAIAGGIAGIVLALFGTKVYIFGDPGLLGAPAYISPDGNMNSLYGFIISNIIGFAISFAIVYLSKYDPKNDR